MIALLSTLLGASATLAVALHRHLRQLDARRRTTAGDFTFDRYDGLGEFTVDVYNETGHVCPTCLRPCRAFMRLERGEDVTHYFYCGHCAPPELRPVTP